MYVSNRPRTSGLSDSILTDNTGAVFLARDTGSSITYVTFDGTPYTPVPPIAAFGGSLPTGLATAAKQDEQTDVMEEMRIALITAATAPKQDQQMVIANNLNALVSTAAKQDSQITLLGMIQAAFGPLATAAKQDSIITAIGAINTLITNLNGIVALASKQDTQTGLLTDIKTNTTGLATASTQNSQSALLTDIKANTTGLATSAKQDTLLAAVATSAKQDAQSAILTNIQTNTTGVALASKQDAQTTLLTTISTGMATAAKQDVQTTAINSIATLITTLNGIVATAAKQDAQTTVLNAISALLTTLNGIVALASKQDVQTALLTLIEADLRKPLMDHRIGVALGLVANARALTIRGTATGIPAAGFPILLWEPETDYPFQSAAVACQIVSTSGNDTAAGTGARTVVVSYIDSAFNEQIVTLNMNGTTAVALPTNAIAINEMYVATSGSGHTNAGAINARVTAAPTTILQQIVAGQGLTHAYIFTVPAGKRLMVDNFYINNISGLLAANTQISLMQRLQDGTIQVRQTNFMRTSDPAVNPVFLTPVSIPEKTTLFIYINSASAAGSNLTISSSAILETTTPP